MDCSFDKPFAKHSPKVQTKCARRPKMKEKVNEFGFEKENLPKKSTGLLKTVLTTQPDYFRQKSELFSSKSENNWKIWRFCEKNFFLQKCPLDTKKTVFTTMSKNFYKISNLFHQSQFVGVNFLEENDNVMQEDPLNECGKQFFKPCGRLSDRNPQSFTSNLEKTAKVIIFFKKHTFLEKFCCSSRRHFWQLLQSFCANVADSSVHSQKKVSKLEKIIEKTVQSKISFGHIKCSFDEPAESSYRTPNTFSLKFRWKTWVFFRGKKALLKIFSDSTFFEKGPQNFW